MGQIIFASVGIYLALGIFFAVYFVISGVARMDPVGKGSPVQLNRRNDLFGHRGFVTVPAMTMALIA